MKIAIILSRCHRHGSSRYVIETAPYMADGGHEVHIFCNSWDPLFHKNIFFHHVPTIVKKNLLIRESVMTITSTLWQLYHRLKGSFDVTLSQPTRYFSPQVGEMQFVYASWIEYKRKAGIKDGLKVRLADAWLSWMEKRNIKKCREFTVLSKSVKADMMRHYGVPENKITVCYSGVNLAEFNPENKGKYRGEIRGKFGIGENDKLAIFVGNPFSRKGLDYLFEALAKTKDVKLLVCGKDDLEPYKKLAEKLSIENRVFYNPILTPEINKFFAAADFFAFPTLYETFGLVIVEAMATGIPVITSALAGAAELITDGKEGFLLKNPEDPAEIAAAIGKLINSDMDEMGRNARATAEKLTWEKSAKARLSVLERVSRGKGLYKF